MQEAESRSGSKGSLSQLSKQEGADEGLVLGASDGLMDGSVEGTSDGLTDGGGVGLSVGVALGEAVNGVFLEFFKNFVGFWGLQSSLMSNPA